MVSRLAGNSTAARIMTNTLVIPLVLYSQVVLDLLRIQGSAVLCRIGNSETEDERLFLVRDVTHIPSSGHVVPPSVPSLLAVLDAQAAEPGVPAAVPPFLAGRLSIGTGDFRGCIWATVRIGDKLEAADRLVFPGSGMHIIGLNNDMPHDPPPIDPEGRYSRTIGALGGEEIWERLRQLRVVIVGCGRLGSLVAVDVARLGVLDETLVDPDGVEPHNRCEMDGING